MMKQTRQKILLSLIGIGRVLKRPKYLALSLALFLLFLFLFNLFASGTTYLYLIINLPLIEKIDAFWLVYQNLLSNISHLDKIIMIILSLAEAILLTLIIFALRRRKTIDDRPILEGGLAALLGLLSAGCPVCGGVALLPLLAGVFGIAAYAWLSTISLIVSVLALIPMFFALKRQGFICYNLNNAEIILKERKEQKKENEKA